MAILEAGSKSKDKESSSAAALPVHHVSHKSLPQHLFGCHPEGQCPQVNISSKLNSTIIGERIVHEMNENCAGDIRGEEGGGLLSPLQEPRQLQGEHDLQGGQRRPQEPGPSAPGAGDGVRGAHAGRDPARARGRHTVYEILTHSHVLKLHLSLL